MSVSVFISHSTNDDAAATKVAEELTRHGIKVWIDHAQIRLGDSFVRRIEEGLNAATHVLVLLSKQSVLSDWVREEINTAKIFAINGEKRIIPVLLNGFEPTDIPILLASHIYVDLNDGDFAKRIATLAADIRGIPDASLPNLHPPSEIDDYRFIKNREKNIVGIEMILINRSDVTLSVVQASIQSYAPRKLGIFYLTKPSPMTFEVEFKVVPSDSGSFELIGSVTEIGDEWSRPAKGKLFTDANASVLQLEFPLLVDVSGRKTRIVRVALASVRINRYRNNKILRLNSLLAPLRTSLGAFSPIKYLPSADGKFYLTDLGRTMITLYSRDGAALSAMTSGSIVGMVTSLARSAARHRRD
jgi:hypothetical protein